jgi:hypothetical protein
MKDFRVPREQKGSINVLLNFTRMQLQANKALKTGIPNYRKMEMLDTKNVRVGLEQDVLMFYGFKTAFNNVQLFH